MMTGEMTDSEIREQIERANRFITDFSEIIAATIVESSQPLRRCQASPTLADRCDAGRGALCDVLQSGEPRCGIARRAD